MRYEHYVETLLSKFRRAMNFGDWRIDMDF